MKRNSFSYDHGAIRDDEQPEMDVTLNKNVLKKRTGQHINEIMRLPK